MQSTETVLGVIRERGRRGLPLERLYRQLFNKGLFLIAYGRLYRNDGAMTPGINGDTVDGMSLEKIDTIIGALRTESYRWTPVKRVYIEKKGTKKKRPLGLPPWSDKLVAEVVRLLLEAYYDVQFSDRSHGFRPGRGCHTALTEVVNTWKGTRWFVEGDISDCFGTLDHEVMLSIMSERIHDGRFLQMIGRMLKAGYLEDWRWHPTFSGAPQGGVASPILSNIYLDRLDQFVEQRLLPEYNRGDRRRDNPAYRSVINRIAKARRLGDKDTVKALRAQARSLPSQDPNDPGYRRLNYCRYADDWLLGFAGPKHEAEAIKARIRDFLRNELRLELSESKTLITHAASQAARFLGYEIRVQHANDKIDHRGHRSINGAVGLFVPRTAIQERCARYMRNGKPQRRGHLLHDTDFSIVAQFGAEFRGVAQYYLLAQDVYRLSHLQWVMLVSMLKTLAAKHQTSVTKMARKYKATIDTPGGRLRCFEVTVPRDGGRKPLKARFGGIPLKRQRTAKLTDRDFGQALPRNELIHKLLTESCALCDSRTDLQVHHIRKLADVNKPGRREKPEWMHLMARRRRKALVVCRLCHEHIHAGKATAKLGTDHWRAEMR
ncbi:reverse transcriptase/maturase family protein [Streptomyces antimycoticus]|uniref:reverse transcriptase/maturase family protein n=1 Tax=Streptomyces antimycoticus TaxID=68175 RepID=UPI0037F608DD